MQNQNEQNLYESGNIPPQQNHGGHELFDTHQSLGTLTGGLEQYMLFAGHVQDQELMAMMQRQKTFLSQLYNTLVETLKTGQDPKIPTQTYQMEQTNNIVYGMQPSAPKSPSQSVNEINDECVSSFIMGILKSTASSFTMTALEVSNPVLRRVISDSIPNIIEMAYEVFLYQNKHQYYQVAQLQPQDMQMLTNAFAPIPPIQGTMPH